MNRRFIPWSEDLAVGCAIIGFASFVLGAAAVATGHAADMPVPLVVYLNKPGVKTRFVARGTFALPGSSDNPISQEGGQLTFTNGLTTDVISLPGSNWSGLGTPAGSKGFRYKDPSGATCRVVIVKGSVVRGVCRPSVVGAPPYNAAVDPPILVQLSIGASPRRYCAECPLGGTQKGDPVAVTKMTDCGAPGSCAPICGNGVRQEGEHCDGSDDSVCPGVCASDCTCPPSTEVCCQLSGACAGGSIGACTMLFGGTPVGGGAVCDASGVCGPPPGSTGGCCEASVPLSCTAPIDEATCVGVGTYHPDSTCQPSGTCLPQCGDAAYPACGGSCPPGQVCQAVVLGVCLVPDPVSESCFCVPETGSCSGTTYPPADCNMGPCPANEVCLNLACFGEQDYACLSGCSAP